MGYFRYFIGRFPIRFILSFVILDRILHFIIILVRSIHSLNLIGAIRIGLTNLMNNAILIISWNTLAIGGEFIQPVSDYLIQFVDLFTRLRFVTAQPIILALLRR